MPVAFFHGGLGTNKGRDSNPNDGFAHGPQGHKAASLPGLNIWRESKSSEKTEPQAHSRLSYHANNTGPHVDDAVDTDTIWHKIVHHFAFHFLINFMILLNTIQMGLAADYNDDSWTTVWFVADNIFTAVFLVEMVLKLAALRTQYFYDSWNVFDASIVVISVTDTWLISGILGEGESNFAPIRLFRMLRLLRMVKLFRMIPELMMVMSGIVASLKSVFYVFGLLALVLYVFSIVCVQLIGGPDSGYPGYNPNEAEIKDSYRTWNNHLHFGTLMRALLSLSNMVLLAEWPTTIWPVWEQQGPVVLLFIVLVFITTFGIMNVIIGVIVERTNEAMARMHEEKAETIRQAQMETSQKLAKMILDLDSDHTGTLCIAEMTEASKHGEFMELLSSIGFPKGLTFEDLHHMLDKDADGAVTEQEFVDAMFRIIYGTSFQHTCMLHVQMGEIKLMIKDIMEKQETLAQKAFFAEALNPALKIKPAVDEKEEIPNKASDEIVDTIKRVTATATERIMEQLRLLEAAKYDYSVANQLEALQASIDRVEATVSSISYSSAPRAPACEPPRSDEWAQEKTPTIRQCLMANSCGDSNQQSDFTAHNSQGVMESATSFGPGPQDGYTNLGTAYSNSTSAAEAYALKRA